MKKIHLNRQSGVILASSSLIFDVISSNDGGHFSNIYYCCDYWFNAHAVTIGSMRIYEFWVTSLRGRSSVHCKYITIRKYYC